MPAKRDDGSAGILPFAFLDDRGPGRHRILVARRGESEILPEHSRDFAIDFAGPTGGSVLSIREIVLAGHGVFAGKAGDVLQQRCGLRRGIRRHGLGHGTTNDREKPRQKSNCDSVIVHKIIV